MLHFPKKHSGIAKFPINKFSLEYQSENRRFFQGLFDSDLDMVKSELAKNSKLASEHLTLSQVPALWIASIYDKTEDASMIRVLLKNGADIEAQMIGCRQYSNNVGGANALKCAIEFGRTKVVKVLLENHAEVDEHCLRLAAYRGHFDIFKLLIEASLKKDQVQMLVSELNSISENELTGMICFTEDEDLFQKRENFQTEITRVIKENVQGVKIAPGSKLT